MSQARAHSQGEMTFRVKDLHPEMGHTVGELLTSLRSLGMPAIAVKGPATYERWCHDPCYWLRCGEVDTLADAEAMVETLRNCGMMADRAAKPLIGAGSLPSQQVFHAYAYQHVGASAAEAADALDGSPVEAVGEEIPIDEVDPFTVVMEVLPEHVEEVQAYLLTEIPSAVLTTMGQTAHRKVGVSILFGEVEQAEVTCHVY
jgi:hypothetical protein